MLLLLLCGFAAGQDTFTNGLVNGRFWASISTVQSKRALLLGFREGLKIGILQFVDCGNEKVKIALEMSFPSSEKLNSDELISAMDRFYAEPLNRAIPIGQALIYIGAEVTGMKPAQLAEVLADFRRDAATPPKQ
jgi:hypothetical protein